MTHKSIIKPPGDIYIPLHVGSALGKDLGFLRDDLGENISDLNPYFGELTGYYWIWKNYHDAEIVGVCHYRRFFGIEGQYITADDCEQMLSQCDIITSNVVSTDEENYKKEFARAHNIKDLLLLEEAVKELYPSDYDVFKSYLEKPNHTYGNLCIMKKEVFDEYCEWLFSLFLWMIDKVDFKGYDEYHKRLFGFLSENMIRVFAEARGYISMPGTVYITDEKSETRELKLAIFQLLKEEKIKEAKALFNSYLTIRPDVLLPLSDVNGELGKISEIIKKYENSDTCEFYEKVRKAETISELICIC